MAGSDSFKYSGLRTAEDRATLGSDPSAAVCSVRHDRPLDCGGPSASGEGRSVARTRGDTIPGGGSVNPGDYLSAGLCDPGGVGAMGQAQVGGGPEGYVSPS